MDSSQSPSDEKRAPTELERAEIALKKAEVDLKEAELSLRQKELAKPPWVNPIIAALAGAFLAALGNLVVNVVNNNKQIALEDRKAEQSRILEMLKTGDPDKAAENLQFLIDTGLIADTETLSKLNRYLENRNPGEGASLASSSSINNSAAASRIWSNTSITVCFENPEVVDEKYLSIVKNSVNDTWGAHSNVKFVGWEKCKSKAPAVHVRFKDEAPHTKALGKSLLGLESGVILNAVYENWSPVCKANLEKCLIGTTVHQFGHVLGFSHEQNRPDAPPECRDMAQGETNMIIVGPYDPHSVMNYCNPKWNNDGELSAGDIAKLTAIYGTK